MFAGESAVLYYFAIFILTNFFSLKQKKKNWEQKTAIWDFFDQHFFRKKKNIQKKKSVFLFFMDSPTAPATLNPPARTHEWFFRATSAARHSFPMAFMFLSCILGIFLVYKANTNSEIYTAWSFVMYFFGMILMLPSLVLFFTLYQFLLHPRKQTVFQEPSEIDHPEQA